ncbi:hypothetical protein BPAE_0412g00090 [Botrytis paeoniae]|uniref:Uncharacterized protein n=1 Tax=Botrytis paeoniae TaxID=278948 RepID=A0A4Z1F8Q8_9HELO|nr:hypothetical protein BPAE_0412g00090 [Botrytis paeoniae]
MNGPSYTCRLSRLEWLNTREEDEELEELEDNDMDEELDAEFEKLLCDALASEEYMDEEDMGEGINEKNCNKEGVEENDRDNNQERDEILDLMTDDSDWEDYDEDEDPYRSRDNNLKRYIEVREQEKLENLYRDYHTLDFANDDDVEKVRGIIKKSIRLEAEQNRAEAEGDIEEVAAEDDAEYENEQRATRESLISEGLGDEAEFPRNTNPAEFDEEQAIANPSVSKIADGVRNNREIDRWCMEQGFTNLFNFINGHGGDYYDDKLVSMIGHQLEEIIEEGNQNGREVMEEIFEGLTMCDNQDQGLKENFQDWPVADNEEMNRPDDNDDDEMTYGWL